MMKQHDLKPILDLLTDWLLDVDPELINGSERERKAMEQAIEASHLIYVAAINLDLIKVSRFETEQ